MQNILDLDIQSYATAVGHAAAVRLAQVLGPEGIDPNFWFCDAGHVHAVVDGEAAVAAMGAYVAERTAVGGDVGAEQLFIKSAELALHRHPNHTFAELDVWVRVAFGVFASVVGLTSLELGKAQSLARAEEGKRQAVALSEPVPVEDTIMEQEAGANEKVFEEPPVVKTEIAGAPVAPDAAPATAGEGVVVPPSPAPSVDVEVQDEHYAALPPSTEKKKR